jgi:hypothetical protein
MPEKAGSKKTESSFYLLHQAPTSLTQQKSKRRDNADLTKARFRAAQTVAAQTVAAQTPHQTRNKRQAVDWRQSLCRFAE